MKGKNTLALIVAITLPMIGLSQKPKKTYDHEKFAKKAIMSMAYIEKTCADDAALKFISEKTGVSVEELQKQQEANLAILKEDVTFIMDNGVFGTQGSIELTNVKESPVKTADIVVNYTNKVGDFQYVLTNCVQTNISWYMGDGIDPRGAGVQGIIANRQARKEKAENGFLGKLEAIGEKQDSLIALGEVEGAKRDSINALRKGYLATPFPMQGIDKSSKYYHHDQVNMPLQGYYITHVGEKIEAVIAYQKPEFFVGDFAAGASLFICKEANNTAVDVLNIDSEPNYLKFVPKDQIQAFYVGGQLFANIKNVGWRIVTSEGAIHTFVNMVKVNSNENVTYQTYEQTQKLGGTAYGSIIGGPSTNVFLDLMEDCPEIAQELKDGTLSRFEAIIRYNHWFDLSFPEKVEYIPGAER
jgi:hypothetical protein